jgi:hypothetical protein
VIERRIDIVVAGIPQDDDGSGYALVQLTYSDGTTTDGEASLSGLNRLAHEVGLTLVRTSNDTFRWERLPHV